MKKRIFKILAFSVITLVGALLIGCAGKKDFTEYTNEYEPTLNAVNIALDVSEIEVNKCETGKIILHYYDTEADLYSVSEGSGVINMLRNTSDESNEKIKVGFGEKKYYKVTVSVPGEFAGTINLQTSSGDVTVKGITSDKVKVNVMSKSGDVKATGVVLSAFSVNGKTSEIKFKKVNIADVTVVTASGDVRISDSECAKYAVNGESAEAELKNVSIGQVSVTLTAGDTELVNVKVGSSVYVASTDGDISSDGLDAGSCTVTTKNGDIYLENLWIGSAAYIISEAGDIKAYISDSVTGFNIDSVSEYGKNNLAGISGFGGFKNLTVRNITGDINIKFY